MNVFGDGFQYSDDDPPGYRNGMLPLSDGGELAVKAYELAPGESLCP